MNASYETFPTIPNKLLTLSKIFQMYWRKRNLSALYVWLFGPFTPTNSRIDRGDTVQQALEKAQGQIDEVNIILPTEKTSSFTLSTSETRGIRVDSSGVVECTIPLDTFGIGTGITLQLVGTGSISIVSTGIDYDGVSTIDTQYDTLVLWKIGENKWTGL